MPDLSIVGLNSPIASQRWTEVTCAHNIQNWIFFSRQPSKSLEIRGCKQTAWVKEVNLVVHSLSWRLDALNRTRGLDWGLADVWTTDWSWSQAVWCYFITKAHSHSKLTRVRQREGSSLTCAISKLAFPLLSEKRGTKARFHSTKEETLWLGQRLKEWAPYRQFIQTF